MKKLAPSSYAFVVKNDREQFTVTTDRDHEDD